MTFNGFISYSHAADGRLAPAVQRGLHRLGKPWHRRRALWIFRDQTGLAVTPGLWSSIQTALDGSEFFVLLASPEAARSVWVNREIEHWMATKSAERVLPVVTDGEWVWDNERGDFTEGSTAVPPTLRGVFAEEPFFLDLRWTQGSEHLSLQHSRFRDAIAQLAAPMHGVSKDELEGEDVRQHRRARRLLSVAAITLLVLTLLASVTGVSAIRNAERARNAAAEALRQQQVADNQRDSAARSATEASRQGELAKQEQARASQASLTADQAEKAAKQADQAAIQADQAAKQKQTAADQAAAEARRQRQLADQATSRKQEQERLAEQASERAQQAAERARQAQQEADRLARVAAEQRRQAAAAAAAAAKAAKEADRQQHIAVSRRLMNQAQAQIDNDPRTALMLGVAAQRLNPDVETLGQFAGVVTGVQVAGRVVGMTAAAYGRNGVLAMLGSDSHVTLWDVTDPLRPAQLSQLPDVAAADATLQFTADRRALAFMDAQRRAALWDVSDPAHPVRLATVPTSGLASMTLSGDGSKVVTEQGDEAMTEWDITDRTHPVPISTIVAPIPVQTGPIVKGKPPVLADHLSASPDGRYVAGDLNRRLQVYDVSDRAHPATLDYFYVSGSASRQLTISPDGKTLAIPDLDGTVALWDLTSPNNVFPMDSMSVAQSVTPSPAVPSMPPPADLQPDYEPIGAVGGLTDTVTSLAYSPDGRYLAAGDQTGTAMLWDLTATPGPTVVAKVQAHGSINSVSIDPVSGTMVTGDSNATVTVWRLFSPGAPDELAQLAVPGATKGTVFGPGGRTLIAPGSSGTANTWDITDSSHPVPGAPLTLNAGAVNAVAFSPDRRTVATVATDGKLRVADVAQPAGATTLTVLPGRLAGLNVLSFSPDGRTLAVAADSGTLMLWDVADRARPTLLTRLTGAGFGAAIAFSPDGRTLATAGPGDRTITLWDVADRSGPVRIAATIADHSNAVVSLAFSYDGRDLASGSDDSTVMLWDVTVQAHPQRVATLMGHRQGVKALAFSPDGRTLASVGGDATVILWDATAPAAPVRLAQMRAPDTYGLYGLAFRNDGRTLAVTGWSTVALWSYDKLDSVRADPAKYACAITRGGLDRDQWSHFIPELPYQPTC